MEARRRKGALRGTLVGVVLLVGFLTGCRTSVDEGRAFLAARFPSPSSAPPRSASAPPPVATPAPIRPMATPRIIATSAPATRGGARAPNGPPPVLVFLDPGHGGVDSGSRRTLADGRILEEKDVTLALAQRTARLLRDDGIGVALSREDDSLPGLTAADYTSDGQLLTPQGVLHDLQRRIDAANASGAHVLLSIHLNAFTDPSVGGSETFYDASREFAGQNQLLAQFVQTSLVTTLRARGLNLADRGTTADESLAAEDLGALGVPYHHLVLLGPEVPGRLRASQMPGVLSEPLFLSNPAEAAAAVDPAMQEAIARAYADAIEKFLRS